MKLISKCIINLIFLLFIEILSPPLQRRLKGELVDLNQVFIIKIKIFHILVILIEKECLLLLSEIIPNNN